MTEDFCRLVLSQFKAKFLLNAAKQNEISTMRAEVDRANIGFLEETVLLV